MLAGRGARNAQRRRWRWPRSSGSHAARAPRRTSSRSSSSTTGSSAAARRLRSTTAARASRPRSAFLAEAAGRLGDDPFALEDLLAPLEGDAAGRAALDAALHDWVGRRLGVPVWRLLGLSRRAPATSFTIGIDTVEGTRDRARRARGFHVLKVKVGPPRTCRDSQAVREQSDAPLRVDANEGWTLEAARELVPALVELGVELIEQPFPAADHDAFRALRELEPRPPLIVDEGCQDLARRGRGGRLRRRHQRQARQVRGPARGAAHDPRRASARAAGDDRLHGRVAARRGAAPRSSPRSPTGSTSTDTCCWPTSRSPGSSSWTAACCPSTAPGLAGSARERAARDLRRGPVRRAQRQDRPRRDPLRHARGGRGDRLDAGGPHRRRGRALQPAPGADRGDARRGDRARRGRPADRRRAHRRQARPGLARHACARRSRPASTSRPACTPSSPRTRSCAVPPPAPASRCATCAPRRPT